MMKKLICTALMLLAIQLSWAVNAKQLFNEFKNAENADYVSIPSLLLKMGQMFMDDEDKDDAGADLAKKINSMKVLDLEKCSDSVKRRFMKRVNELNTDGYEELMRVNGDEDEKVKILIREEGTTIKEMLIVCSSPDDCALIQFTGDFKESDIEALVKQETDRKHD